MLHPGIRLLPRSRLASPATSRVLWRQFSATRSFLQEHADRPPQEHQRRVADFPWLLHKDAPRIPKYPYVSAPSSWGFIGWLPKGIQHALSQWLGTRILQLNTGMSYFPDQFLLGASMATRRALEELSKHLSHPQGDQDTASGEQVDATSHMFSKQLIDRYTKAAKACLGDGVNVSVTLPQIYDCNLGDIWVTLGSSRALSNPRQYDVFPWMTTVIALKKSIGEGEEESFSAYRARVAKGLMEGVHIRVDVLVDADVVYKVTKGDEVLAYDEGRRIINVQFETPYFEPANLMVSGRDEETNEPLNDWSWRISDIDQLLESEALEKQDEEDA